MTVQNLFQESKYLLESLNMKKPKKSKKHGDIIRDYEGQKSKQLEKLATKMLENEEKFAKLKSKETSLKFLKFF
jgi:hypothetical protein